MNDKYKNILLLANNGIKEFLKKAKESNKIDEQLYRIALENTFPTIKLWLDDPNIDKISPNLKSEIKKAIKDKNWENLVNAFRQNVKFGTGGIREKMAFDRESIIKLKDEGLDASILKGPNTINNLVLLITSVGVARYGIEKGFKKIVIGYDSRIRGFDFAKVVAELFLAYNYTVYFFDAPCPYPEVTYAIPSDDISADIGILISASHNDYRYNGYKLSCANGSQFDINERTEMYEKYIVNATTSDIRLCSFEKASSQKIFFLGGECPLENNAFDYAGKECNLINIHEIYLNHIQSFLMTDNLADIQEKSSNPLKIGYCAFHGAGNIAVPKLLKKVGYKYIWSIKRNGLNECNGLFPQFEYRSGLEQQPDPGDIRAASIAVDSFRADYPGKFENMDILIGTDPDADRCGVVVKVPENQKFLFKNRDWTLLPADDLWALIIWYRIFKEREKYGKIKDVEKKFVTLSFTTSDSITKIAQKYGIGVIKTWVGFASLAAATEKIWNNEYKEIVNLVNGRNSDDQKLCHPIVTNCYNIDEKRSINIAAMEQSNGFSILGAPPKNKRSLGQNGHVRDKDGLFASFLVAEIAAWAKEHNTTLYELIDNNIHLDPDVGLFVNGYQPDPLDGEYPGIEGDSIKKNIIRRALGYFQLSQAGDFEIAGIPVKSAYIYRTGKYDTIYPPTYDFEYPDEGIRFFFDPKYFGEEDDSNLNHITIRPSGTGNSLRLHTQLHSKPIKSNLITKKYQLYFLTEQIFKDLRTKLKAPEWKLYI